jgi:hypothetical protein
MTSKPEWEERAQMGHPESVFQKNYCTGFVHLVEGRSLKGLHLLLQ